MRSEIFFAALCFTERLHCYKMQTAVISRAILSVRPSVCLSVYASHSGVLSRRMRYDRAFFCVGRKIILLSGQAKFISLFAGDHHQ